MRARLSAHRLAILPALTLTLVVLSGCSGLTLRSAALPAPPTLEEHRFLPAVAVPAYAELIALPPALERSFLDYMKRNLREHRLPSHRIIHFLKREFSDIRFGYRTLSVADTVDQRVGNCMSLALLTTALARAADVDIGWQLSNEAPLYDLQGEVIFSANHIQTRLENEARQVGVVSSNGLVTYTLVDYFNPGPVRSGRDLSEQQMIGLLYQNLGAEALADHQLDQSFWLLRRAVEHDPGNGHAFNALGVVHRRVGAMDTAEALFRHALELAPEETPILRNLRDLLRSEGRMAEADAIERKLLALSDNDPFPRIVQGDRLVDSGQLDAALDHYRAARRSAPYLHEVHFRLARVFALQGRTRAARRELEVAMSLALEADDRQRYRAKLDRLIPGH